VSSFTSFHPLAWLDAARWRKQRVLLIVSFLVMPLLISVGLWSVYVSPYAPPNNIPDIFDNFLVNLWGLQIFLSLWLGLLLTLRATPTIASLRESGIWPLVKIMPYTMPEMLRQKMGALERGMRWPIRLVLALRVASVALALLNTPGSTLTEVVLLVVFMYVFGAELIVSVRYNIAVGVLASTLTRTSVAANRVAYGLQGGLFLIGFAPLWWYFFMGWPSAQVGFQLTSDTALLQAGIVQFGLLAIAQLLVIGICSSLAIRRMERMVD
jgi:hypothetical protein